MSALLEPYNHRAGIMHATWSGEDFAKDAPDDVRAVLASRDPEHVVAVAMRLQEQAEEAGAWLITRGATTREAAEAAEAYRRAAERAVSDCRRRASN